MGALTDRASAIAAACKGFESFLGEVSVDRLAGMRDPAAAVNTLHVAGAAAPHGAMRSLLRSVISGGRDRLVVLQDPRGDLAAFAGALDCGLEISEELPDQWIEEADTISVFGSDELVDTISDRARADQQVVVHGHGVSLAIIERPDPGAAALVAQAVSALDQHGPRSPHCIYVDGGGREFAALVAEEMAAFDQHTPRRELSVGETAELMQLRGSYSFREGHDSRVRVWESDGSSHWTVIYEEEVQFAVSCLNRLVFVKPFPGYEAMADALTMVRDRLDTIALWPFFGEAADKLANCGAATICPLGRLV